MIAKIVKVTKELLNSFEGENLRSYSYNLPLFGVNLDQAYQKELSEYVLQLWQINNGYRYPTWIPFINEDDLKVINATWDWMIQENMSNYEFLL